MAPPELFVECRHFESVMTWCCTVRGGQIASTRQCRHHADQGMGTGDLTQRVALAAAASAPGAAQEEPAAPPLTLGEIVSPHAWPVALGPCSLMRLLTVPLLGAPHCVRH
jgi:hypothetical protein